MLPPDFSTWLDDRKPLELEDRIRVLKTANIWPRCVGRVIALKGDLIGVYLPGLTDDNGIDWYPRDQLARRV